MKLRERQKADTRAALLAAASELFARDGFEHTTTRAIAVHAGVATGTLFLHFPDKDALVAAILYEQIEVALEQGLATLPEGLIPQLVHVATTLYAAYDARPELARVLVKESLFAPEAEQLRLFGTWCAGRVAEAVQRGEVPPVDPMLAFYAYFSHYFAVLVGGLRGDLPPELRGPMLARLLARFFQIPEVP